MHGMKLNTYEVVSLIPFVENLLSLAGSADEKLTCAWYHPVADSQRSEKPLQKQLTQELLKEPVSQSIACCMYSNACASVTKHIAFCCMHV